MRKVVIVILFFFFIFNSYAQKKEYKIEIFPISEIDSIKQDSIKKICDYIDYECFTGYTCTQESRYVYTSKLHDTLTVYYLVFIRLYFTDTLSYFLIDRVERDSDDKVIFNKKREMKLVKKIIFQREKNRVIYYEEQLKRNSQYLIIPLTFVPTKTKAKRTMIHKVIFL